jgi:hypothetical protein
LDWTDAECWNEWNAMIEDRTIERREISLREGEPVIFQLAVASLESSVGFVELCVYHT